MNRTAVQHRINTLTDSTHNGIHTATQEAGCLQRKSCTPKHQRQHNVVVESMGSKWTTTLWYSVRLLQRRKEYFTKMCLQNIMKNNWHQQNTTLNFLIGEQKMISFWNALPSRKRNIASSTLGSTVHVRQKNSLILIKKFRIFTKKNVNIHKSY
jgi:hypothetical protein